MNKKIKELAAKSNMSVNKHGMAFASRDHNEDGIDLALFTKYLIEECAMAAELHARSYSDGDAGTGCYGAANAVRGVGKDEP